MTTDVERLVGRLRDHASAHEYIANADSEQKQWMNDLYDAADAIEKMLGALNWYAEMAKQMQRATLHGDSQYMLGMMKELALDGGKKAREAMRPNAGAERHCRHELGEKNE